MVPINTNLSYLVSVSTYDTGQKKCECDMYINYLIFTTN